LDEDKPLEQAFLNHLNLRRAAKHKLVPQDIDPTFPTSDPELDDDDEEDEVSDNHPEYQESDHTSFLHGAMEMPDDREDQAATLTRQSRWVVPKKRSPAISPKRLRSPPPTKKISLMRSHRSPPPPVRRARSPAPQLLNAQRLSSSMPRRGPPAYGTSSANSDAEDVNDDGDNTPRFNRGAIDIVMGLEKKRQRRREKLYKLHCRKTKAAQKGKERKVAPGKGAEKMRDLGLGLNAYRGKGVAPKAQKEGEVVTGAPQDSKEGEQIVHMLSY